MDKILEYMRQEGFNEEEIKNFEIKMLLNSKEKDFEQEEDDNNIEIVSYEEYFSEE